MQPTDANGIATMLMRKMVKESPEGWYPMSRVARLDVQRLAPCKLPRLPKWTQRGEGTCRNDRYLVKGFRPSWKRKARS
jgi:hypothetical protein